MLKLELKMSLKYAPFVLKHLQISENFIFGGIKLSNFSVLLDAVLPNYFL